MSEKGKHLLIWHKVVIISEQKLERACFQTINKHNETSVFQTKQASLCAPCTATQKPWKITSKNSHFTSCAPSPSSVSLGFYSRFWWGAVLSSTELLYCLGTFKQVFCKIKANHSESPVVEICHPSKSNCPELSFHFSFYLFVGTDLCSFLLPASLMRCHRYSVIRLICSCGEDVGRSVFMWKLYTAFTVSSATAYCMLVVTMNFHVLLLTVLSLSKSLSFFIKPRSLTFNVLFLL